MRALAVSLALATSALPLHAQGVTRSVSGGIEVVENSAPEFSGGDAWSLRLLHTIGALDAAEPYQFSDVGQVATLRDGMVAVVEESVREVRVFDATGTHVRTFGGAGEGPGEFQDGPSVASGSADTLMVVWDGRARRMTWFGSDGRILREASLVEALERNDPSGLVRGARWDLARNGGLLVRSGGGIISQPGPYESVLRAVLVAPLGSEVRSLAEITSNSGVRVREEGRSGGLSMVLGVSNPLGPRGAVALSPNGDRVLVFDASDPQFMERGPDGSVRRMVQWDPPRIVLTDAVRDRVLAGELEGRSGTRRESYEAAHAAMEFPDVLPATQPYFIEFEPSGNVWVGRRALGGITAPPEVFDVFDATGRWLTAVGAPEGLRTFFAADESRFYCVWYDEFDVPYIRVYQIVGR